MSNHNGFHFEEKNTEHQYIIDALAQSSHFDYDTLRSHKIPQDLLTWQDVTWPDIDTWLLTIDTWRLTLDALHMTLDICNLTFDIWHLSFDICIWHLTFDIWHSTFVIWHWYDIALTQSQTTFADGFCGYLSNLICPVSHSLSRNMDLRDASASENEITTHNIWLENIWNYFTNILTFLSSLWSLFMFM